MLAGRVAAGLLAFAEGLGAFAVPAFFTGALTVLAAAGLALGAAGAAGAFAVALEVSFGLTAAEAFFVAVAGVFFAAGGALLGSAGLAFGVGAGAEAGWASPKARSTEVLSPSGVPPMGKFVRLLRKINHSGLLVSA